MLLIYNPEPGPRFLYTVKVAFDIVVKTDYRHTTNPEEIKQHKGPVINYSDEEISDALKILPAGLLFETDVKKIDVQPGKYSDQPILFNNDKEGSFPFDVFSAIFFMVSRYEEYLDFEADHHGRFPATQNTAVNLHFAHTPIVHHWVRILIDRLKKDHPALEVSMPHYSFLPTYDIDNAFAYKNKSMIRTAGGLIKSILSNTGDFRKRLAVLTGKDTDPYDNYTYIDEISKKFKVRPLFFFLTADISTFDKNISPKSVAFREIVNTMAEFADIGIHPSYRSSEQNAFPKKERDNLAKISGQEIKQSRQHFLKLRFPHTFRNLLKSGITDDYSLGFAEISGYRTGMCRPFPYFDLIENSETGLMLHPFCFMEATFQHYRKKDPREIKTEMSRLIDEVRSVGGIFCPIWHNESLGEYGKWKGWREIFEYMHEQAKA